VQITQLTGVTTEETTDSNRVHQKSTPLIPKQVKLFH